MNVFALFRITMGLYLFVHFAMLVPYAGEVFSNAGMLPDPMLNPTAAFFPSVLHLAGSPAASQGGLVALAALSLSFAAGLGRRVAAVLLWYGWACLFNRNVLIANPGIPYVGWLLLASALVPLGEGLTPFRARDPAWKMPRALVAGAWVLLALGYSISGFHKMTAPSWLDGTAMLHLLSNPLARDWWVRDLLLLLPLSLLKAMTWGVLVLEAGFALFCLNKNGRFAVWLAMLAMHIGIIAVIDFADLTFGMIMVHIFTFDAEWLGWLDRLRSRSFWSSRFSVRSQRPS